MIFPDFSPQAIFPIYSKHLNPGELLQDPDKEKDKALILAKLVVVTYKKIERVTTTT